MAEKPVDFVSALNEIADELMITYQMVWNSQANSMGRPYKQQHFPYKVIFNGQVFELQITVPSYWKFVEYGQPPHEIIFSNRRPLMRNGKQIGELMGPPISELKDWLTIKKGVPSGEALRRAIMIDRKIAKNNGRQINHPGFKGKHLLETVINESDYVSRMANEIARLMNVEINNELISVFDGLKTFKIK